MAFGGLLDDSGVARVTNIVGNRTTALRGLAVAPDRGLGGRALAELRPRMTGDYGTARQITHDYDSYVLGEGIGTLIAVPVLVDGRPRGILYGGTWGVWNVGGVTAAPAVQVAEDLGRELSRNASALLETPPAAPSPALSARATEELRESYAELRTIAASIDDDALRERLARVEQRLAALTVADEPAADTTGIRLSRRENRRARVRRARIDERADRQPAGPARGNRQGVSRNGDVEARRLDPPRGRRRGPSPRPAAVGPVRPRPTLGRGSRRSE